MTAAGSTASYATSERRLKTIESGDMETILKGMKISPEGDDDGADGRHGISCTNETRQKRQVMCKANCFLRSGRGDRCRIFRCLQ